QQHGWGSTIVWAFLALAAVLFAIFIVVERGHKDPLVPLDIFSTRSVASANTVGLLAFGAIFPFFFFLSLFMQQVLGYDALKTGFAFLPFSVSIIVTATFASQLVPKIGVKKSAMIGTFFAALGMLLFGLFLDPTLAYFPGVLIPMIFLAMGMGMTFVPLTFLATSKVEPSKAGLASGLFNTTQQVGGAFGLAILATLATSHQNGKATDLIQAGHVTAPPNLFQPGAHLTPQLQEIVGKSLVAGWQLAFLIGAALIALAFVASALRIRDEDADLSGDLMPMG
ncbi:MAG: MFS transporter, partial [Patulibacter sp.]|nr:MFS transporter [Patulibacter sp.]